MVDDAKRAEIEEILKTVDGDRRAFLKKLLAGAVLALPAASSVSYAADGDPPTAKNPPAKARSPGTSVGKGGKAPKGKKGKVPRRRRPGKGDKPPKGKGDEPTEPPSGGTPPTPPTPPPSGGSA